MTLTGPAGPFTIEQLTARHTVTHHGDGTFTVYRDCVVVLGNGARRLYGIPTELLEEWA